MAGRALAGCLSRLRFLELEVAATSEGSVELERRAWSCFCFSKVFVGGGMGSGIPEREELGEEFGVPKGVVPKKASYARSRSSSLIESVGPSSVIGAYHSASTLRRIDSPKEKVGSTIKGLESSRSLICGMRDED